MSEPGPLVNVASPVETRVIDGIIADLNNNAGLPEHSTVYYRRPAAVLPENCPLLCVWMIRKVFGNPTNLSTYDAMEIGITWQVDATERALTLFGPGEGDEEGAEDRLWEARELFQDMKRIENRIRMLAGFAGYDVSPVIPGVPEMDTILPGGVNYIPAESIETGLVEGYAMTVEVTVHE